MACALCGSTAAGERFSGLDLCGVCRQADPAPALRGQDIQVDFSVALGWFGARSSCVHDDRELYVCCVPELLPHKVLKFVVAEVEVGDPVFDDAVYVRTNAPDRAALLLAHEGVQSAVLGILAGARRNDMGFHHVTLEDGCVVVRTRHGLPHTEEQIRDLRLETAALLLHLTG